MSEIKYEIIKKIGVLSTSASGWAKEVNLISWHGKMFRLKKGRL